MKEELRKSLTDLIDETLLELEELKKSRFAASEIEIKGPGEGIAGKPSNGDLHAKKAEDDEEEKEEEKEEEAEKAEGSNEEAQKAEGVNEEKAEKAEDKKDDEDEKEPHKDDPKHEEKEKAMAKKLLDMHKDEMKKSLEDSEALLKSFVDERVKPLEDKLSSILDLVNKIAEQPVPPKGTTSNAVPLHKSADDAGEPLSKSDLASKLFELKKSGTKVDSLDITRVEMGQDLHKIADKYKIS